MRYFIRTFGCQMNVADSDYIAGIMEERGYTKTDNPLSSDIIVINTCAVRQHAEDRALSYLGTLKKLKDKNPQLKIYLAGCVASLFRQEKEHNTFKKRFPYVDEIIPADCLELFHKIADSLPANDLHKKKNEDAQDRRGTVRSSDPCEFVTISRGCSNYCSYCVVPYTRGPLFSRAPSEIMEEISFLARRGVTNITLLGQNVNAYDWQGVNFATLLKKVSDMDCVETIGFLTSHPKDMSDDIIETIATCDKIRKSFHLPLQSASDRILSLMNRNYTASHYKQLVEKIRARIPSAIITTDIMVGFPTETDADFEQTLSFVKNLDFENFFAFKYSPRPETASSTMNDDVPLKIKEERLGRLLKLLKNKTR